MYSDSTRLLHVDDDVDFAEMVSLFLRKEREAFEVDTVHDVGTALDRLETGTYHCVVSDYEMPGETGLDLLRAVRAAHPDLPFVLFTGRGSEEIAAEAVSAGVSDYLQKGGGTEQYTVLANRVENLVAGYRTERHLQQRVDAIEAASEGIGLVDDGAVVYANRAFAETLGYDADELAGVAVEELFVEQGFFEREIRPLAVDERWTGEVQLVRRDGTRMLADVTLAHTIDDGVVCTLREVTATERQEHELFVKEWAMDAAPIGIILTDPSLPDNGIIYANDEFERLTGYREEEILGDNCRFLQGPETDPEQVDAMREAIEGNDPVTVELRNYRKDGTSFWNRVTVAPIYDRRDQRVTNYVGFQRDVTEQVDARREQEAVFDRVSDAFFALDRDWRFTYLNDQAERLLDTGRDELVGRSVWEEFPEAVGSTFEAQYRTAMETQGTVSFEEYYPPLSAWFEVRAYPSETGLSVYFRDVSERKANERRLEQRTKQFETFGDVLSHDLKTPLSTLEGRLRLARERGTDEQFDAAEAALDRIEALVDDLANVMREGSVVNDVRSVDLTRVARGLWSSVDTADATLDLDESLSIRADEKAVTRLLQNLVRNCVEHGGPDAAVTIGRLDDGDGFFVADDGPGVPPGERDRLFEPGYSTKEGGTGFGMVSVRQITLAHGWDIEVTESETGGARFEIRGVERPGRDAGDDADDAGTGAAGDDG